LSKEVVTLLEKYGIQHPKSCLYRPQANGAGKVINKNIWRIIEMIAKNYKDWLDKLPFALWGYRMLNSCFHMSNSLVPYIQNESKSPDRNSNTLTQDDY